MSKTDAMQIVETPEGWERGTHCGYPAFYRGDTVVYASPKGRGWIKARFAKGANVPWLSRTYSSLAAATMGE